MDPPRSRPLSWWPSSTAICCILALACSDEPLAPAGTFQQPDPHTVTLLSVLADPWVAGVVDGIAEPSLRIPFQDPTGDVASLGSVLERAHGLDLTPEDRLSAAILELSLVAAERLPFDARAPR